MIAAVPLANALAIQVVHGSLLNQEATIDISMYSPESNDWLISGFNLLVTYDQASLSFTGAVEGDFFRDCDWEYFTYREGYQGNCQGCPSGVVRLVASADDPLTIDGPDCYRHTTVPGEAQQLVHMHFLVDHDSAYACDFLPVSFFWSDCEDNHVSSVHGDTTNVVRHVFDYTGESVVDSYTLRDGKAAVPGPDGVPDECEREFTESTPIRSIDFYNGGFRTACPEPPDFLGDIDKNNEPNEIGDVLIFANYFVSGLSAFTFHIQESVVASDINRDGIPLSVADLVLLIQIVIGEGSPWITLEPTYAEYSFRNGTLNVNTELGGAYLVFDGEVEISVLADGADYLLKYREGNTHVLLYLPLGFTPTSGFAGDLVHASGNLLSYEFATFEGQPIIANLVPGPFTVYHTDPDPSDDTKIICFDISEATHCTVVIRNRYWQRVATLLDSTLESGYHCVDWDASGFLNGTYYYIVTAGEQSRTGSMELEK